MKQPAINVRFKSSEHSLIKKAAKSEGRSMNTFIVRSAVEAAKASLALEAFVNPASRRASDKPEATA